MSASLIADCYLENNAAMANEPPFDWQMMNLENYLTLSPVEIGTKVIDGVPFKPRSAGSGLHG